MTREEFIRRAIQQGFRMQTCGKLLLKRITPGRDVYRYRLTKLKVFQEVRYPGAWYVFGEAYYKNLRCSLLGNIVGWTELDKWLPDGKKRLTAERPHSTYAGLS